MSELDERIARLQHLLSRDDGDDHDVLAHTLRMLRLLRTEMELVPAD